MLAVREFLIGYSLLFLFKVQHEYILLLFIGYLVVNLCFIERVQTLVKGDFF